MGRLTVPGKTVERLRAELVQADAQERFAFVHCGLAEDSLLAGTVETVPDEVMARQSPTACRPSPAAERRHVESCHTDQLAPLFVHSHPFSDDPRFSSLDVESMDRFREWLGGLFPTLSFGFAVVGREGLEATGCLDGNSTFRALDIEVLGSWKLDQPVPGARSRFALPPEQPESEVSVGDSIDGDRNRSDPTSSRADDVSVRSDRFDRNVRALGEGGQRRIQAVTVGVVGLGGLGSMVVEQMARLGVEEFVLVDPDTVEASNLPRLVGAYDHHIGKPKVDVVCEHLWRSTPSTITVETHAERVQTCVEVLDRCDVVIGCVDTVTARSFCNEYAVKQLQYYLDVGVRIDTADEQAVSKTGYIHLVAPGSTACFDCLGRHDQDAARLEQLSPAEREAEYERGYLDDDDLAPEPAVIHLNGICTSKAVSVIVDLVTGSAPPDFIRYEDHVHEMTELVTEASDSCPTCGADGVLGVGRRSFGDIHEMEATVSD